MAGNKPFSQGMLLRCIVAAKGGNYQAVCLELGLMAVGDTFEAARQRLEEAIEGWIAAANEIRQKNPHEKILVRPVPFYFWKRLRFDWLRRRDDRKRTFTVQAVVASGT